MAGRPAAIIDWKAVDRLLQAGCAGTQIAARLGIRAEVLYDGCQREHKTDFTEYSRQKKEHGETLLHEQQFALAMKGNLGMLVWLGKQRLGQKERSASETETLIKVLQTEVVIRSSGEPLALDEKDED